MRRVHCLAAVAALLAAPEALAQGAPSRLTVGLHGGVRVAPGLALAGVIDLDLYLDRGRVLSLGPGLGVSFLGGDGGRPGQGQDLLLAVDVLRFKINVGSAGGRIRPTFYGGLGFSYASLAAVPGGTFPTETDLSAMLTFGAGMDIFLGRNVALSALGQPHFHLGGSRRVPDVWAELATGLRVGF
jgi:hypothetical protein